jgi:ubiquinone/menaquinone biosynthesis C-methylase UbiE
VRVCASTLSYIPASFRNIQFQRGNAAALPLNYASVDFVVCRAAFKNFTEPEKALAEMHRVLRPDQALVIDMRRDASMADIKRYVETLGGSVLNRWYIMLTFRFMLIKRAYPPEEFRRMVVAAGWPQPKMDLSGTGFEASMKK